MGGHVEVNNSAGSMFHDHKHVKDSKSGARHNAEVTGDDGISVILEEG
jgi:hypothetical protein